jgi:hypothetical protein
MIIDLAFDAQGNLYVLQHATGALQQTGAGILIRVTPDTSVSGGVCEQYQAGARTVVLGGPGQFGVALPFRKIFTISVTKMSAKRFASQKPMFTGPFGGQKSSVHS